MIEGLPLAPSAGRPERAPRQWRRLSRAALVGLAAGTLLGGLALATPAVVFGADGYTEHIATTYTMNPNARRIDVAMDIDFKNTTPSTATTIYYYNGDNISLEHQATHVRATSPGETMTLTKKKSGKQFDQWFVRWEPVLFYGRTRHVHLTYQIPTGSPRSSSPFRVNAAYADFCVVAQGVDGGSTTVKVPLAYTMDVTSEGGTLTPTQSGPYTIYKTGNLSKPYDFWGCLTGENPSGYSQGSATSPSGRKITIEAWPDDFDWAFQVKLQIGPILEKLEALVGTGLPGVGGITVREVGNGTLGNYAGFFDSKTETARIGEDLQLDGLIAHELSHAWFNDDLFHDRWMSEGAAEWARISIVSDTCPEPTSYPGDGTPHLANWQFAGPKATDKELDVIDYQYSAACAIVSQVAAKVGPDRWRTILHAMLNHQLAYQSGGSTLAGLAGPVNWHTWLDDVDELGLLPAGVTDLDWSQKLLLKYGIPDQPSLLADRSTARKAFHALPSSIGDWTVPEVILRPMGFWDFTEATTAMTKAAEIYSTAAQVKTIVAEADGSTGKVETMFEAAKVEADLDAALAEAKDEVDAATTVKAARDAFAVPLDLVGQIGMMGVTLQPTVDAAVQAMASGDLATARADAAQVQATLADAPRQGQTRIALAVGVVLALLMLLIAFFVIRRRRRRATAALALASMAAPVDAEATAVDAEAAPIDAPAAEPMPDPPLDPPVAGPPEASPEA